MTTSAPTTKNAARSLDALLASGDFAGARAVADWRRRAGVDAHGAWRAYAAFHARDFAAALPLYEALDEEGDDVPAAVEACAARAACLYRLGRYDEARDLARRARDSPLRTRLLFHLAQQEALSGAEGERDADVLEQHALLGDTAADQLTLAAAHCARGHYPEAVEVYRRLLAAQDDGGSVVAANVYAAAAFLKLELFEKAEAALEAYAAARPLAVSAANARACATLRLHSGKAAEGVLHTLSDAGFALDADDVCRHNLCVFRGGGDAAAARVLSTLVASGAVREARPNLAVHYLRARAAAALADGGGDEDGGSQLQPLAEAWALVRDGPPPVTTFEHVLTAVVHATVAAAQRQRAASSPGVRPLRLDGALSPRAHEDAAMQHFHAVGSSPSECDTVSGRQAMASFHLLSGRPGEATVYLDSIREYARDAAMDANYGVALAVAGRYADAVEPLAAAVALARRGHHPDYNLLSWLCRCLIFCGRPAAAWGEYLRVDSAGQRSVALLQLIGDDCYKVGAFHVAARAFDVLQRIDAANSEEHAAALLGAAAGAFQLALAAAEATEVAGGGEDAAGQLRDVVDLLLAGDEHSEGHGGEDAAVAARVMSAWLAKRVEALPAG